MIIDTNALSAWKDEDSALLALLAHPEPPVIPVIVIGEYLYGVSGLSRRNDAETWLRGIIGTTRTAPINLTTARIYAQERARLRRIGQPLAANDLWIASTALELGLPILSRDTDFDRVEGITRVSW